MSRTDPVVVQARLCCHSESHFSPERVEVSRFDFEMLAPGVNLGDCRVQVDSFSRRKQLTAAPHVAPGVVLGPRFCFYFEFIAFFFDFGDFGSILGGPRGSTNHKTNDLGPRVERVWDF